jgi:hypothetical protein
MLVGGGEVNPQFMIKAFPPEKSARSAGGGGENC